MSFEKMLEKAEASAQGYDRLEAYFEGRKRLDALGVSLPPEVRVLELIVNWPRLVVNSIEERLDIEGFRLAGNESTDDQLWSWWQTNNLDAESSVVHTEALYQKRAFTIVGPGREGQPAITTHSRKGMALEADPLSRDTVQAMRLYQDPDGTDCAAHYTPEANLYYKKGSFGWKLAEKIKGNGTVPVTQFTNQERLSLRYGESEMQDVIGMTDACCRTLTGLQVSQELVALPGQYVAGATAEDFQDRDGNPVPRWQAYIGYLKLFENENAKVGQIPGADLRQFIEVVKLYSQIVAGLAALPPHFVGLTTDNPASAEAITANTERLVKRCERKQRSFGASWERTMRCAMRQAGMDASPAMRLEAVWRDAATPTLASKTDAAVKLFESGLLPADMALELIGFSAEQRKRAADLRQNPTLAAVGL